MPIRVRKIVRGPSSAPKEPTSGEIARVGQRAGRRAAPPAPAPRTRQMTSPPLKMKVGPVLLGPSALGVEGIHRRAMTMAEMTWLEVLGLREGAGQAEVHDAYVALKTLWDPEALSPDLARARSDVEVIAAHIDNAFSMLAPKRAPVIAPKTVPAITSKSAPTGARNDFLEASAPTRVLARPPVRDTLVDLHAFSEDDADGS